MLNVPHERFSFIWRHYHFRREAAKRRPFESPFTPGKWDRLLVLIRIPRLARKKGNIFVPCEMLDTETKQRSCRRIAVSEKGKGEVVERLFICKAILIWRIRNTMQSILFARLYIVHRNNLYSSKYKKKKN